MVYALGNQALIGVIKSSKTEVDLTRLPDGIYFLKIGEVLNKVIKF